MSEIVKNIKQYFSILRSRPQMSWFVHNNLTHLTDCRWREKKPENIHIWEENIEFLFFLD